MKSWIVAMLAILVLAFYQNMNTGNTDYEESLQLGKAYNFLNYVMVFDEYFEEHSTASGEVTQSIILPLWLPENSGIKAYINGGRGYVFMPSDKGVISEVLRLTEYSALVGITDDSKINITDGTITKPSFIPKGYIVYVR